ncbi:MAG: DNA polymerase III subunit beta [Clostridiales bacterium]|jgi:DNA polymerase-3 subunit beta|nr:DNA polymerase III subunit beta [Clostridiales bacterium]
MRLILKKEILINSLNKALRIVSNRNTLEILECILLTLKKNNLIIYSNNLELSIEISNSEINIIDFDKEIEIAVNAKLFTEIIKKMPNDDIIIEIQNNEMIIKDNEVEFKLSYQNAQNFPKLYEIEKSQMYKVNAFKMIDAVKNTIFASSQDETKPILTGELLEIQNDKINFVSLDGFRIAFKSIELIKNKAEDNSDENIEAYIDDKIIVPSKSLLELIKILPNNRELTINFYITDKHAFFEFDNCLITTRLIEGEYINYFDIFNDNYNFIIKINRLIFLNALERATLIAFRNKREPVKINIEKKIMTVACTNEINSFIEKIDIDFNEDKNLEIAFNPKYLCDALRSINQKDVLIFFNSNLEPCEIKPSEDKNSKYLILPLKLF